MVKFGSQPTIEDGFETGDYRNFAPVYLGTESDWIRPTAAVTSNNPIEGEYSLCWSANQDSHKWAIISNSFYLSPPLEVNVDLRVEGPPDEPFKAGLGIAETQTRAAVVRTTESGIELATAAWDGEPAAIANVDLSRNERYRLSLRLEEGRLTATINDETGSELAQLSGESTIEPHAVGLYVDTAADGNTTLTFDNIAVNSAPYRIRSDEWARSPQFVVLPRAPDVEEDQGNWVGAPSVINENDRYRMWYRIRNNEQRGAGFGLAMSEDGITWEKHDNNPVLMPDHNQDSNEGIAVLRVDDTYHAWYTINRDDTWHIVHTTSNDGVKWVDHGIVIEGYCKDPCTLYVDGTYYLYAIAPTSTEFSVYVSDDGHEWSRENTIGLGSHGHPAANYIEDSNTFWLYAFAEEGSAGPASRVRRAASEDGIHFQDFEPTWHDPPVGLDHRPSGGIDYGAFPGNGHGHLADDRRILMYYQARHDYRNNRPNWRMAGDGKVVLGGRFSGLFEDVPTTVDEYGYEYHGFPTHAKPIPELDVAASKPATIVVDRWTPTQDPVGSGTVETTEQTDLTVTATALDANREYVLRLGADETIVTTETEGTATFDVALQADSSEPFELAPR